MARWNTYPREIPSGRSRDTATYDYMPMIERIFDGTPNSNCTSPKVCGRILRHVREFARYKGQRHNIGAMLQSWSGWIRDEMEKSRACVYCERALYERERIEHHVYFPL
ncbi:hypothetical protein GSI_14881 [Ganoderma sinense ZZ0214-1]|uniref:Uncharacterized protein n=1 Tax=Ganoderma sinense ZZ0214-1 TaxID=1077348 RepID=A0A2G8RQE6_9APHY|nr:hypothetical protein GSI_14881 [Ganoderma sinense ZZ0214-1]